MKKLLALVLVLAVLWSVSGCQLAREDSAAEKPGGNDRLIGVLITREYLDLFDVDAWLSDNLDQVLQGDVHIPDTSEYQGRIYATRREKTVEGITTADFVFEGIEGIRFFAPTVTDGVGESYGTLILDEGISDVQRRIHASDTGAELGLEGTVYVSDAEDYYFCMNPVYQDAQGRIYMVSGNSNAGNMLYEMTLTLDATATVTENGTVTTQTANIRVTFASMDEPEQVTVLQMGADHSILDQKTYAPGSVPQQIIPLADTAYILVETLETGGNVSRVIYSPGDAPMKTYYAVPNGLCVAQDTHIEWSGEE